MAFSRQNEYQYYAGDRVRWRWGSCLDANGIAIRSFGRLALHPRRIRRGCRASSDWGAINSCLPDDWSWPPAIVNFRRRSVSINDSFLFFLSLSLFFPPLSLSLFLLSFFFVALLLSVSVSSYPIFSLHFKSGTKGRRRRSRGAIRIFTPSIHHPGDIWKP